MRYVDVFCWSYSLETGTKVIAWFQIVIYTFNGFLNIFSAKIVESYKEREKGDFIYDKDKLLAFHYICLGFGILTIVFAAAVLSKITNQSETFWNFFVKWNIFRCIFVFVLILYVCVDMDHFSTVFLSSFVPVIDICVSVYFAGILASFLKFIRDPNYEIDDQKTSNVQLVSHKKTFQEDKTSPVEVVVDTGLDGLGYTNTSCEDRDNAATQKKGVDGEEQETEVISGPSNHETSKEVTEHAHIQTVEVVMETIHPDISTPNPESNTEANGNVNDQNLKQDTELVTSDNRSEKSKEDSTGTNDADADNNERTTERKDSCPAPSSVIPGNDEVAQDLDFGLSNPAVETDGTDQSGAEEIVVDLKVGEYEGRKSDVEKGIENAGLDGNEMKAPEMNIESVSSQD